MDGRLDAGNLACAELLWASSILEIALGGKQDCLCDDSSWNLTYSNRSDAWTLVEGYQAACQQREMPLGSTKVVHSRLAIAAKALHNSLEADLKEVQSLRQPCASIPEGPAAPRILLAVI